MLRIITRGSFTGVAKNTHQRRLKKILFQVGHLLSKTVVVLRNRAITMLIRGTLTK